MSTCRRCPCGSISVDLFDQGWAQVGEKLKVKCVDSDGRISLELLAMESTTMIQELKECNPGEVRGNRLGVPTKSGVEKISKEVWRDIRDFIKDGSWDLKEPAGEEDLGDELLSEKAYGKFMLGFDFHVTEAGPKLIEINTNAGGLATAITIGSCNTRELEMLKDRWFNSLIAEYRLAATPRTAPIGVAIVDTDAPSQGLYPEMQYFADILRSKSIPCVVCSPSDLTPVASAPGQFMATENDVTIPIDMIYNRLVDFRLTEPCHQHIRTAALAGLVLTPHPAAYARVADKRALMKINHDVIPKTYYLSDKPIEEWQKVKKNYVFKPANGNGSKGVYRGDKISNSKLATLPPSTLVQEYCTPAVSEDGTKYDIRVYTQDRTILAVATRQFSGQVMEMNSPQSGFRTVLPPDACCFSALPDI
eukprot:TRINITY_DN1062_c1_g1_i1.p1 TRINITY_DN1062_c1_g1~~TRINITY_DN1062_c1_g1_i1.p1  ORF type:complete len:420 (+),score=50.06 TRINITY_DN1062_c1_g1_i1:68-1327(+)